MIRILFIGLLTSSPILAQEKHFVPQDFQVPELHVTEHFRLRPLTASDAEKDFEAVKSSAKHLRDTLNWGWPSGNFTLEENKRDLAEHEKHHKERRGFTYTVMSLDESKVLGCVYIYTSTDPHDAEVYLWVRKSAYDQGMDPILEKTVRAWLKDKWPFKSPRFPGRS